MERKLGHCVFDTEIRFLPQALTADVNDRSVSGAALMQGFFNQYPAFNALPLLSLERPGTDIISAQYLQSSEVPLDGRIGIWSGSPSWNQERRLTPLMPP